MPSKVRKAVIPAAGWGTRFLPVTKAVPKEVLPIIDRPMIQYVIEEAVAAGLTDIVLVTSSGKGAIESYFDRNAALERFLEAKGDAKPLEQVRALGEMANILTVRQKEQLGLGHAVLMAKPLVGNEPFAVLLPDDIIEAGRPAIQQLLEVYRERGGSVLAVQQVNDAEVSRYGIINPQEAGPRTYRVKGLVEKPKLAEAPSHLAIIGRYVLTPQVFQALEQVRPGAIGEIQLTDGLGLLLKSQPLYAYAYEGMLLDGGTPLGLLKASILTALRRPDMREELRAWLREVEKGEGRTGRRSP